MALADYRRVMGDHFPRYMFLGFCQDADDLAIAGATEAQHLLYEKVAWSIVDPATGKPEVLGLRYGENPGQEAALYRPINGNLTLAGIEFVSSGDLVGSIDSEAMIQSGKHPGKTNLTDIDNGLNILKYFPDHPAAAILKHNNPSGAALGNTLFEAYTRAWEADPIAPMGGALVVNRPLDKQTAEAVSERYYEIVCAPDFEPGVVDILSARKNLRIIRIRNIAKLSEHLGERFIDLKSLCDGCIIPQWSFIPTIGPDKKVIRSWTDIKELAVVPADVPERDDSTGRLVRTGKSASIGRKPTDDEYRDLWFGWMVEAGVISNSVLTVNNLATVSIAAGGQDRVSISKLAVAKAYESRRALFAIQRHGMLYDALALEVRERRKPQALLDEIDRDVAAINGGLKGAAAVSDAFFPYRDGADALLDQGITAIIQPGDALRDYDVILACNERKATMVFTGQRSFRH